MSETQQLMVNNLWRSVTFILLYIMSVLRVLETDSS